jgi:hypothetical protein
MTGSFRDCCARATSGHAAAKPIELMNSRRLTRLPSSKLTELGYQFLHEAGNDCCVATGSPSQGRGRDEDCSPPPAQIRTGGSPASGSCRRSDAIGLRGIGYPCSSDPWARRFGDKPTPALCPGPASPLTLPSTGRLPSTISAADLWSALFEASSVQCSRPTPHAFLPGFAQKSFPDRPGTAIAAAGDMRPPRFRTKDVTTCSGSPTARGPSSASHLRGEDVAFRTAVRRRHLGIRPVSQLKAWARGLPCERFAAGLATRISRITRGRGGWLGLTPRRTCTSYPLPAFLAHAASGQFFASHEIADRHAAAWANEASLASAREATHGFARAIEAVDLRPSRA